MLYGDLVNQVLRALDEFSKKGIPNSTVKTADYRAKIPDAVNEIQQDLANGAGRLPKELLIANVYVPANVLVDVVVALPADWLKLVGVMIHQDSKYWMPFVNYRITPTGFVYNSFCSGDIVVTYYRKPTPVAVVDTSSPTVGELAQVIDVIADALYIVPTGVAGKVLAIDSPAGSSELLNYYEARKYALNPGRPVRGIETIVDVYN